MPLSSLDFGTVRYAVYETSKSNFKKGWQKEYGVYNVQVVPSSASASITKSCPPLNSHTQF